MRFAFALCFAALAWPSLSAAQTRTVESTPIVIHVGQAGEEGVAESGRTIIQRQRVTTIRAVQLDTDAARPSQRGRQREGFPAGERLFGIYDGYDGWAYCALRDGFLADALTCYKDADEDGRFEIATAAGAPFQGIPFFIFANMSEDRALATPAAYHRIPYRDGPTIEAALEVRYTPPRRRRNRIDAANVTLTYGYVVEGRFVGEEASASHRFDDATPATLELAGAQVEFTPDAEMQTLHYRVVSPIRAHIRRVTLQMTTYTTTTYIPIYIPR